MSCSYPGQQIGLTDTNPGSVASYNSPGTMYGNTINNMIYSGYPIEEAANHKEIQVVSDIMQAAKDGKINITKHAGVVERLVPVAGEIRGMSERYPTPDIKMKDTKFAKTQKKPWNSDTDEYAAKKLYPLVQADMSVAAQRQFISLSNKPGVAYTTAPSVIPGVPLSYFQPRCTGGPQILWKQALQVLPFIETADYDPFTSNDNFCIQNSWLGRDYAQYWTYPSKLGSPYVSPASPEAMPMFLNSDKSYLSPHDGAIVSGQYLKGNLCAEPNCVPFCHY